VVRGVGLALGAGPVGHLLDLTAVGRRAREVLLTFLGGELHAGTARVGVVLLALIRDVARVVVYLCDLPSDWCSGVGAPEELGSQHPNEVHRHEVEDHRLRGRGPYTDGASTGVVPVIAAHYDDDDRHRHGLYQAV